jgi:hypothetical protein
MHYRAHGFQYLGMITVVTDVVRENNQTYRLGWSENAKDGTKMGCGMPEYILLLRKPQSDRSRSYADVPVTKSKEDYTRARWQIDAHGLWRSSGNRHLTPEEFANCSSADLAKLFAKTSAERIYDFEAHVKIGEAVERTGTLPATFMAIAPGSHHPDVWTDINRMRTLNMMQQRKGAEMHLCPLQFDIVDRLIERYSNEGELMFDPFGGLMTVPYRALLKGRKGAAVELSASISSMACTTCMRRKRRWRRRSCSIWRIRCCQYPPPSPAHADDFQCGNWEAGRFAWKRAAIIKLNKPIPYRGRQSMFTLPDEIAHLIQSPRSEHHP